MKNAKFGQHFGEGALVGWECSRDALTYVWWGQRGDFVAAGSQRRLLVIVEGHEASPLLLRSRTEAQQRVREHEPHPKQPVSLAETSSAAAGCLASPSPSPRCSGEEQQTKV